jgi:predicted nucleotidyltransferase
MLTRAEILRVLRENKPLLQQRFNVRRIGLFGSYAREEAGTQSDIDTLVEMEQVTFDNYMDLKFYLEDLFQSPVDLVLATRVKPRLRPYIEEEVIYA